MMRWRIYSIGKPSLTYAKQGIAEYTKRLQRYAKLETAQSKEAGRDKNSKYLLAASEGTYRIALDERGKSYTTQQFATKVTEWQNRSQVPVSFIIGGAEGHSEAVREAADEVWSLSSMTLQHELALVVLLEQIYRVHTLLKGEPYHRD